ncbi:MAG: hypothetical protein GY804_10330 [Alphaproteobacteria bacterium]|nr:hypothetical protein [Alphaproteobacteria bacterium]
MADITKDLTFQENCDENVPNEVPGLEAYKWLSSENPSDIVNHPKFGVGNAGEKAQELIVSIESQYDQAKSNWFEAKVNEGVDPEVLKASIAVNEVKIEGLQVENTINIDGVDMQVETLSKLSEADQNAQINSLTAQIDQMSVDQKDTLKEAAANGFSIQLMGEKPEKVDVSFATGDIYVSVDGQSSDGMQGKGAAPQSSEMENSLTNALDRYDDFTSKHPDVFPN